MESNSNNQWRVGLFVLVGLIGLLSSIILLGGNTMLLKNTYHLYVRFEEVQGLAVGSVVSLSGLKIGNVSNLDFSGDKTSIMLELNLDEKYKDLITTDAQADVKTQGALGDKYIYITPGPLGGTPLKENEFIQTSKSGNILEIFAERGSELERFIDLVNEAHSLVSNLNAQGQSRELIANLNHVSKELRVLIAESQGLIKDLRGPDQNFKKSILSLQSVLKKMDRGEGTLGALINDPSIFDKLNQFLGESEHSQFLKPLIRSTIKSSEKKN